MTKTIFVYCRFAYILLIHFCIVEPSSISELKTFVTLEENGVTCGEKTGSATYKLSDGTRATCAYECPAGRRTYNASLAYLDPLSEFNLVVRNFV